ncbi:DUF4267 domain-containing protein [Mycolicibacterium sp. 018/SC-01/001]|uniref:DUF4267 domain-containing protein n=1 Tax=Mycolicibacterium sp. 018/SC-01/001 TaxID=2592069 RepID=UPI00118172BC|nr:DUF4267 domain-containing protein [Mycolicibacterium sp. 018/SC-01/001]TRW82091.1 DUF4267 domain-containing protein [Mycolicibacterium sp. 018/SC-01/001]
MTTTGYVLAGLLAVAIIVIGVRFLVAPAVAAAGYGVPTDADRPDVRAYLSVKGLRDISTGVIVIVLIAAHATHLVGWAMLAATIIPLGDAVIVLRSRGARSTAYGMHGGTAAVMLLTSALLIGS